MWIGKVDEKQPSIFAAMNKVKDKEATKKSKAKAMFIDSDSNGDSDIQVTKTTKG